MSKSLIAEELAKKQKEVSVAEFFERNKHILGFDSLTRAVLTSVKESVDNSLDACEEAEILPEILVEIQNVGKDEYKIIIEDNGPGIVSKQIPNIFGRLLYGSRFHSIRQSRGQQGIGVSSVVMYGQLTTGKPTKVISKIGISEPAHLYELVIDTAKNRPHIINKDIIIWRKNGIEKERGTRIETTLKGRYIKGKQTVYNYLKSTGIVNPHAKITFIDPESEEVFERITDVLPKATTEIKPHPKGIELGTLIKMLKNTDTKRMASFLQTEFSRVSKRTAMEICKKAEIREEAKPKNINREKAKRIHDAFADVKIMDPPTDCLSPIGETLIKRSLRKEIEADFISSSIRKPSAFSGNPFQVEAGLCYGTKKEGDNSKNTQVRILRFANRVPLLYQQGGCVITKAIERINWRPYGLEQRGGRGIPHGPVVLMVHVASTNVPFTSESKEAIADIQGIRGEIELVLRECARKLKTHIQRKKKRSEHKEKLKIIDELLPMINEKTRLILNLPKPRIANVIGEIMDSYMFTENIEYDSNKRIHTVKIKVANYTKTKGKFKLIIVVPNGVMLQYINPKPLEIRDDLVIWKVQSIENGSEEEFVFKIVGLDKEDFEECEIFQKGLNEKFVFGAEVWREIERD